MHDPLKEAIEIQEQIASEKRKIGFFWGAGTSIAVKLPGIEKLTHNVAQNLKDSHGEILEIIKKEFGGNPNIEDILNRLRLHRELIAESETYESGGIKGKTKAKEVDIAICKTIAEEVSGGADIWPHKILAHWIRYLYSNREYPIEIFTTNYDLLIEQALEEVQVPFFDGFVGSVDPFFVPESIDARIKKDEGLNYYPPKSWTRLWKLHGSINWYANDSLKTICRRSGKTILDGQELMIFPSREKYAQSRKLPFIALQDRLRNFLASGETLLIIHGYSFSDDHLNDIIFQCLRSNPNLSIMAFIYENLTTSFEKYGKENRKLTFYAPDKLCVGGIVSEWKEPDKEKQGGEDWNFWDDKNKRFLLGDFNKFASYLESFIGFNIKHSSSIDENNTSEQSEAGNNEK